MICQNGIKCVTIRLTCGEFLENNSDISIIASQTCRTSYNWPNWRSVEKIAGSSELPGTRQWQWFMPDAVICAFPSAIFVMVFPASFVALASVGPRLCATIFMGQERHRTRPHNIWTRMTLPRMLLSQYLTSNSSNSPRLVMYNSGQSILRDAIF